MTFSDTSADGRLDRWHRWARGQWWLHDFATTTRILLAVGFIPPGLTKVLGQPFAQISPDTPIGSFFEAFFQAEGYYAFVGAAQVLAGLLLLWPRTAPLGALLFMPIIINIFVITVTMQFRGTWLVTGLMTLACLFLLAWDYHRLRPMLPVADFGAVRSMPSVRGRLRWAYVGMALTAGVFFLIARGLVPMRLLLFFLPAAPLGLVVDLALLFRRRAVVGATDARI